MAEQYRGSQDRIFTKDSRLVASRLYKQCVILPWTCHVQLDCYSNVKLYHTIYWHDSYCKMLSSLLLMINDICTVVKVITCLSHSGVFLIEMVSTISKSEQVFGTHLLAIIELTKAWVCSFPLNLFCIITLFSILFHSFQLYKFLTYIRTEYYNNTWINLPICWVLWTLF